MTPRTFRAFSEELSLIKEAGFMSNVGNRIVSAVGKGWKYGDNVPGGGWMGAGRQITPEMGTFGRGFEHATSLGGLTKYLPVGNKGLTVGFSLASLPSALKKNDPEGKSRTERMGSLIGGTIGGIAGAPTGLLGSMAAGTAGDWAGGKLGRLVSGRKAPIVPQAPVAPQG